MDSEIAFFLSIYLHSVHPKPTQMGLVIVARTANRNKNQNSSDTKILWSKPAFICRYLLIEIVQTQTQNAFCGNSAILHHFHYVDRITVKIF